MSASGHDNDNKHARMAWRHQPDLVRYLQRRVRKPEDVADLVQEIYERILKLDDSEEIREPLALLHQIANWVLGDFRRKARRNERITIDSETVDRRMEEPDDCPPDEIADLIDLQQRVQRALAVLPRTHAAVLLLHKRDGLSHEEVATSLNISVHTVRKYMAEANAKIRAMTWES
jgi:RNA polymerase sigma-19 factor, ECF subfamily